MITNIIQERKNEFLESPATSSQVPRLLDNPLLGHYTNMLIISVYRIANFVEGQLKLIGHGEMQLTRNMLLMLSITELSALCVTIHWLCSVYTSSVWLDCLCHWHNTVLEYATRIHKLLLDKVCSLLPTTHPTCTCITTATRVCPANAGLLKQKIANTS